MLKCFVGLITLSDVATADGLDERESTRDRQGPSPAPPRRVALAIFLFVGLSEHSPGQLPKPVEPPPSKAEPEATVDPLGRETPRGALNGLIKYGEQQDYATRGSLSGGRRSAIRCAGSGR